MPAYQLHIYEQQEEREALEQKICEQVDACTEVNGTIRNRVKKFLIEEGITDISEMDVVLRIRYKEYLERNETVLAPITCLRGFDGIVIHRMKEELQTLAGRRNYTTEYRDSTERGNPYLQRPLQKRETAGTAKALSILCETSSG